jgi:uncharacterized protein YndB with AHSA1/START domain
MAAEKNKNANREIVLTRVFDAPRELVFDAWTDPKHISNWWGPKGFTTTIFSMDVKPGGVWRFIMHGPDGRDYHNRIVFLEVSRPSRIVFKHDGDKDCEPVNHEMIVTFEDEGGKTKLTMQLIFPTAEERNYVVENYGAIEGGNQTLSRLGQYISKAQGVSVDSDSNEQFVITRIFDAPRDLVFKAWTDRDRLMRWWGPKGSTMLTAKNDLRVGGIFHYSMRSADGHEMWGKWVYREIDPPRRIVFVSSFSDEAGNITRHPFAPEWPRELLSTITFSEYQGRTTLTVRWLPLTPTAAEQKVFSAGHESMQNGWGGTLDRLAEEQMKERPKPR